MNITESQHSGPPAARGRVPVPGTTDEPSAALPRPPAARNAGEIALTKKGEAYAARNWHPADRDDLARRVEAHLAAAEALIAALDAAEADPDLEAGGDDEPSLGWSAAGQWGVHGGDDREDDGDDREPDMIDEPAVDDEDSEGWPNEGRQEGFMAFGDGEPSLGWTDAEAATGRHATLFVTDGELDHEGTLESARRPDSEAPGHALAAAMLARVDRRNRPDPDTLTIIAPGVARLGSGLPVRLYAR